MTYNQELQAVRVAAEKNFIANNGEPTTRAMREELRKQQNEAVAQWEVTKGVYDSIEIEERDNMCEIRCNRFGGSIEVRRPRREYAGYDDNSQPQWKIEPGTISGSSFQAGKFGGNKSVESVRTELLVRLRMMSIAVDKLNAYNSVMLEWKDVENPFTLTEFEKNELDRLRKDAQRLHEEANRKAVEREQRKREKVS